MWKALNYGISGGAFVVGAMLASGGCADPCNDDGLSQKGCPDDDGASGEGSGEGTGDDGATGTGTATTTDDPGSGSESGGECPDLDVVLTPEIPTIQLVVDQSGSMAEDFSGVSRWDAIRTTLIDPVDGVVTKMQSAIRFGLSRYSATAEQCPNVRELAPQLDAADEIDQELLDTPGGDTPTGESLEVVLATLLQDPWDGEKFIVLATDGEPDTCDVPEPATPEETDMVRDRAVQAIVAAFDSGVRSFVVSVGEDIAAEHLQDLANAGAGNGPGDPDAPFYVALDQQALIDAFDDIVSGLRECTLTLDKPLKPEYAPSCDLTINDNSIPYNDPNGWSLDGETAIELQGTSCQAIQDGVVVIQMTCTCEAG